MHAVRLIAVSFVIASAANHATSVQLAAQQSPQWVRVRWPQPTPTWRTTPAVYDIARARTIVFGGTVIPIFGLPGPARSDHWELDGETWVEAQPRHRPSARRLHAMCYDSLRARAVLFGGETTAAVTNNETWSFDGEDWSQIATATAPSPRQGSSLVYDRLRDRVVLFGGRNGSVHFADTWEFDGNNWQLMPVTGPAARAQAPMAFDELRGVSVLTTGLGTAPFASLQSTWEYDGQSWLQKSPDGGGLDALVFDPTIGRVVGPRAEWTGTGWTTTPNPILGSTAFWVWHVYDEARAGRLIGTDDNGDVQMSLRIGSNWCRLDRRLPRHHVWDPIRQRNVFLGTVPGDTRDAWTWDGSALVAMGRTGAPTGGFGQAAFDANRDTIHQLSGNSMHTLAGGSLTLQNSTSIPFQSSGAVIYDLARDRLVAAGSSQIVIGVPQVFETWEYDGTAWSQVVTANRPPSMVFPGLALDPVRGRVVSFGGLIGFSFSDQTWEYDGSNWQQVVTSTVPPGGPALGGLAYDPVRQVMLLQRGSGTWQYDGSDWTLATAAVGQEPLELLGYDPLRARTIGGGNDILWEYGSPPLPDHASYGSGCTNSSGAMTLIAEQQPILGKTMVLRLRGLPPEHGIAFVITGWDDQLSSGQPLPLAIPGTPPGCLLWLDGAFLETAAHVGSTVCFRFTLPTAAALIGRDYFQQGAVVDDLLNAPLPIATSAALRLTAGL